MRKTVDTLTQTEEIELIHRAKNGDAKAVEKLMLAHEPLFRGVAKKWRRVNDDDFMSAMRLCFIENLPRFDPDLGYRVNTYLRWYLSEGARQYDRQNRGVVNVKQGKLEQAVRHIRRAIKRIEDKGESVTLDQMKAICDQHGMEVYDVEKVLALDSGEMPVDTLDPDHPIFVQNAQQDQEIYRAQQRTMMLKAIACLKPREQRIIMTRHFTQGPVLTLEDLSQEFSVSRERIRQVEVQALEKLKASMANMLSGLPPVGHNDNGRKHIRAA